MFDIDNLFDTNIMYLVSDISSPSVAVWNDNESTNQQVHNPFIEPNIQKLSYLPLFLLKRKLVIFDERKGKSALMY